MEHDFLGCTYHELKCGSFMVIYSTVGKINYKEFDSLMKCKQWIVKNRKYKHTTLDHYNREPSTGEYFTEFY